VLSLRIQNLTFADALDFSLRPLVQLIRVATLEETMRRIALFVAILAGCGVTEPETEKPETQITVRVQGTVTAAAEGTAIPGAKVEANKVTWVGDQVFATAHSDAQGRYSLSFACAGFDFLVATCGGFQSTVCWDVGCTNEILTIDLRLELSWKGRYLTDVWGTSPSNFYAVGLDGAIGHYDGTHWSAVMTGTSEDPGGVCGTSYDLKSVWGTSSGDVFVVGENGILHYDGTDWSEVSMSLSLTLYGVWGTSASDVYAVGSFGRILHYDGTSWSQMTSVTRPMLRGVWGISSSDIFAVGDSGTILHYDGTSWSEMASGTSPVLGGVWGTSSSDVFAVGGTGTILHYDGTSWSLMASGMDGLLLDVWGTSSTDVYAVGAAMILHYDGTSWNEMLSGYRNIDSVWGTSSSDVFTVGDDIMHYDGTEWGQMTR